MHLGRANNGSCHVIELTWNCRFITPISYLISLTIFNSFAMCNSFPTHSYFFQLKFILSLLHLYICVTFKSLSLPVLFFTLPIYFHFSLFQLIYEEKLLSRSSSSFFFFSYFNASNLHSFFSTFSLIYCYFFFYINQIVFFIPYSLISFLSAIYL